MSLHTKYLAPSVCLPLLPAVQGSKVLRDDPTQRIAHEGKQGSRELSFEILGEDSYDPLRAERQDSRHGIKISPLGQTWIVMLSGSASSKHFSVPCRAVRPTLPMMPAREISTELGIAKTVTAPPALVS